MVHVSAQLLLTALAISPAIAAPFSVQQYEDAEARDFDDVEARAGALTAAKMFTTLATSVGMGNVFGGFFKKSSNKKRSFSDDIEELSAREEDLEYLLVRDENGSLDIYARAPGAAGLLKIGSAIGKVTSKLFGSSKYVLPAVAVGGAAVGTAAGRKANSRRSLEDDEIDYVLKREEDGSLGVYARSPVNAAGLLKIGSTIGKVTSKLFGSSKYVLPAVAVGGTAVGTAAGRKANSRRSLEDDEALSARDVEEDAEYVLMRDEDGSLGVYARSPVNAAGLLKIGSTIGKVTSKPFGSSKYVLPAVAAGGFGVGIASKGNTLKTRDFDEELMERLFYDDEDHFERELDELD